MASFLDSAWAEEFAQFTNADMNNHVDSKNETYKKDFWRKLEDEWKVCETIVRHL